MSNSQDQATNFALNAFAYALVETLGSLFVVAYLDEFWYYMWMLCGFVFLNFFPVRITIVSVMTAILGGVIGVLTASIVYACLVGF